MDSADDEWLIGVLTIRPQGTQYLSWVSAFSAAIRDARQATSRNMDTGVVDVVAQSGNWLGTLGYLVLVDQIGECFTSTTTARSSARRNDFCRGLAHFTDLDAQTVLTLYALRCAFTHSYALNNVADGPQKRELTHRFLLDNSPDAPLIEHPYLPWSGRHTERNKAFETRVNVRALADRIEAMAAEVQRQARAGELEIRLAGGLQELKNNYTIQIR
jgi:hypothetical protein